MKTIPPRLLLTLILFMPGIVFSAITVNVTFGTSGNLASTYGAAASQPGTWNHVSTTGITSDLLDLNGDATGVSINLTATSATGDAGLPNATDDDSELLKYNFYSSDGNAWSVSLSGVASGDYEVYYYAPGHSNVSTGTFTVEGIVQSELATDIRTLSQGVSWDVATVTVSDGSIDLQSTNISGNRGLAGIQIVAVPEPETLSLTLALFAFTVCLLRRR